MSTFYIQQFGCRATQADGAALERQLLDRGCTAASDPASAAIVVLNTCTVTAAADAQARDAIRKFHSQSPAARLIVTGCYAQRAPEELAALPGVSYVVGNSHKPQLPDLVTALSCDPRVGADQAPAKSVDSAVAPSSAFVPVRSLIADSALPFHSFLGESPASRRRAQVLTGDILTQSELLSAPVLGGEANHTRPTLKIQDGCNLRCSYCVIPFVRGKSRSLPPDAIIREIKSLTSSDSAYQAREIVLSGINLGTYGRDLSPKVDFLTLLRRILDETTLERLRISSIEPQDVTLDLIDLFASTDRLAEHFHMPLQSGSDRILATMHRWYRTEHYARRVELIRERYPHAAIGADLIAGFPGETESDHDATLSFIERLRFAYLHVFSYSSRPGTQAASLPSHLPAQIIKRRARELRALSEAKSAAFRHSQLGRRLRVLTLRRSPGASAGTTPAMSSNYLKVVLSGDFSPNRWLEIQLSERHFVTTNDEPVPAP
ncbi:MAG TPA: tRNA (N(6)-L-threonylcarbamoyladenosine(37)-C(2))-methylthiotransferase MtaB [Candidatus Methylomirabilis sp.]|nr:tRNA (N(6)-L-threonylcarbamoyladenosine(37)-C(2))-methylthiotransferase MtaB [Candidatus Methylomirabilis sp.]